MLSVRVHRSIILTTKRPGLTRKRLKKWFNSLFFPTYALTPQKSGFVSGNASSHSNLCHIREHVVVILLPPNVTFVHQPMDMVVISTWKETHSGVLVEDWCGIQSPARSGAHLIKGAHKE